MKKTHEEYVAELAIKNPTVEVVGEYINSKTKIKHHCLIHDVYWKTTPSRALQGVGCETCKKKKFRRVRCKTHEKYIEEVNKINPDIEVIDKYQDAKTPIKHYCKKHNIFWNAFPDNILKGNGCIMCRNEKIGDKNRKNHKQYIKELKILNPNIIVVEKYVNANTPILHKCLKDGYEWYARPGNILSNKGCPKCAGVIKRSQEEYIEKLSSINPDIDVLDEYANAHTPILHKCKKHNIIWKTSPASVLQGCGCIECSKEKLSAKNKKSHDQYVEELKKINPNIVVSDNYVNSWTPILHKCLVDNNEWYAAPVRILYGNGCPKCNKSNESKGEREIRLWLDGQHIIYETQKSFKDCRDIRPLPFDFYLPRYNKIIEYDGEQHFKSVEYFGGDKAFECRIKHDNIKNEYCKNNDISLLRIPYYKNIEEELNNFLFI